MLWIKLNVDVLSFFCPSVFVKKIFAQRCQWLEIGSDGFSGCKIDKSKSDFRRK